MVDQWLFGIGGRTEIVSDNFASHLLPDQVPSCRRTYPHKFPRCRHALQRSSRTMVDPSTKMDDLEEYRGIKGRIKNLTPAYLPFFLLLPVHVECVLIFGRWFGPTMGTGIVAILLHQLPYQFPGLGVISTVIFLVNAVMFVALCIGSIIRYVVWPQRFIETMLSPVQSCSWYDFSSTCQDG